MDRRKCNDKKTDYTKYSIDDVLFVGVVRVWKNVGAGNNV
jgi:hypothetical protein